MTKEIIFSSTKKIAKCLFILIFISVNKLSFSQDLNNTNHYKAEEEGYFSRIVQTAEGIVCTDNYASGLYLIKDGQIKTLHSSAGCGRYYTLSPDKTKLGFKLINSEGKQTPVVFDIRSGSIKKLNETVDLCGQVSFSDNGSVGYTTGNILNVINEKGKRTFDLGMYSNLTPISPDGAYAVFNDDNDQLHIIDLKTGKISQVTDNKGAYAFPLWAPDSRKLAYSTLSGKILVSDIVNGNTYLIGEGRNPSWSPNSEFILFNMVTSENLMFIGSDIFISDYTGSKIIQLTNTPVVHEMEPVFTDDNNILFHTYNKNYICSASINLQTSELKNINKVAERGNALQIKYYSFSANTIKSDRAIVYISNVPYLNQIYDVPSWAWGYSSCAPTTAVMSIAYFNKLPKWEVETDHLYTHTTNYGSYISDKYHYGGFYFDLDNIPSSGQNTVYGAHGYMWNGGNSPNNRMANYFQLHGFTTQQLWDPSCTFSNTTAEIDAGYPHSVCNFLGSAGHLTLAIGYVAGGQHTIIFHDPYGNKNNGYPNYDGSDSYYDWPGYNNGYSNLNGVAWTVRARTTEATYNDTIIDDIFYNHGFYMNNKLPSHMSYFLDANSGGYNGHMWYTLTESTGSDICYVTWTPNIPEAGSYEVQAYIPTVNANTNHAVYKIYYEGGSTSVIVNQNNNHGNWVSLGTYQFAKGKTGYVYLGDVSGTAGQNIAFDAVKWIAVGIDNTEPTTSISVPSTWQTKNFTATFTDADNTGGSGLAKSMYHVVDNNGTEWRANPARGFYRDNFTTSIHSDWITSTGTWGINAGTLEQTDEALANTNISAPLTQNLSSRYLYSWSAKMEGSGTSRRAGIYIMCDDATATDRGNAYMIWFRVDLDQVDIYKSVNNVLGSPVKSAAVSLTPGSWNEYRIVFDRSTGELKVYVDNNLVSSWTDSSPLTNGSYISFRTGNCKYTIDNLNVYRSRSITATVTVGAASTNAARYQNASPGSPACMIKSIVMDSAGNLSSVASKSVNIDWTAPANVAEVRDGTGNDINVTTSTTQLSANWDNSTDVNSGVVKYWYAIGTTAGAKDVVNWTDNDTDKTLTKTGLSLTIGQMYYVMVKAENGAGLLSDSVISDGQMVQNPTAINELTDIFNLSVFPNPFSKNITIKYELNKNQEVEIKLADVLGKEIIIENKINQIAGRHSILIDAEAMGLAKGIYILKIRTENNENITKIIHY
ncbi:MAG: T9SS type A sorting domain-containing protein [Bacteroidales bacterium]|nr:T9SS type A sorting domain-containing protein [Bacteroidales bacterium]